MRDYDTWKLSNGYENEIEVTTYKAELYDYWHTNELLIDRFNRLCLTVEPEDLAHILELYDDESKAIEGYLNG